MATVPRSGGKATLSFSLWSTFVPSLTSIDPPEFASTGDIETALMDATDYTVKNPGDLVSVGPLSITGIFDGTLKDLPVSSQIKFGGASATSPTGTITLNTPVSGAVTTNAANAILAGTGHISRFKLGELTTDTAMTFECDLQFDCNGTKPTWTDGVA